MNTGRVKAYYEEYWRARRPSAEDPNTPPRRKWLWECVDRLAERPRTLLDVGCGDGGLVAQAVNRGMTAIGMDISERALERARDLHPSCQFHLREVEEQPWPVPTGSVDVVVSFEVIEHLLDPRVLVRGAAEALRPGGYLALTTPYHGVLKNLAIALFAFDRVYSYEHSHIRFFSDKALRRILETNGFGVVRITHWGRVPGLWKDTFVWARN